MLGKTNVQKNFCNGGAKSNRFLLDMLNKASYLKTKLSNHYVRI